MKKHLIFLFCMLIAVAAIVPVWATEGDVAAPNFVGDIQSAFQATGIASTYTSVINQPNGPNSPQETVTALQNGASSFTTRVNAEINSVANKFGIPPAGTMITQAEYNAINQMKSDAIALMNDGAGKIGSTLNTIGSYAKQGEPISYKKYYLQEADNLIMTYFDDLKKGTGETSDTYMGYFESTKQTYINQLNYLNAEPVDYSQYFRAADKVHPEDSLDKGLKNYSKKGLEMDFNWGGVSDLYKSYTPRQILGLLWYNLVDNYNGTGAGNEGTGVLSGSLSTADREKLKGDIAWFMQVWPSASEMLVTGNNYTNENYNDWVGKQHGNYKTENTVLNEYGQIVDTGDYQGSHYEDSLATSSPAFEYQTGGYNNRNYGYRYSPDGRNKTVGVTVGNKEYVLKQNVYQSPLVLDMNGDGQLEACQGKWLPHSFTNTRVVEFDISGDGFSDLTEWVGPNDGILLVYQGGSEVSVNSFFGDVGGFDNGYEKLSSLDKNRDNVISGDEITTLSVWQDKNGNAKVDAGEVASVTQLGITSISLNHQQLVSSFTMNSVEHKMWDCYFSYLEVKRRK